MELEEDKRKLDILETGLEELSNIAPEVVLQICDKKSKIKSLFELVVDSLYI